MGAAASTLPPEIDRSTCEQYAGDRFDEQAFNRAANAEGLVTRDAVLAAAASWIIQTWKDSAPHAERISKQQHAITSPGPPTAVYALEIYASSSPMVQLTRVSFKDTSGADVPFTKIACNSDKCHGAESYSTLDSDESKWCTNFEWFPGATPRLEFSFASAVTISAIVFTSGNDAPERDPTHFALFGVDGPACAAPLSTLTIVPAVVVTPAKDAPAASAEASSSDSSMRKKKGSAASTASEYRAEAVPKKAPKRAGLTGRMQAAAIVGCALTESLQLVQQSEVPYTSQQGGGETPLFNDGFNMGCPCLRAARGDGLCDDVPDLRLFKRVAPTDVVQGCELGDCWLLGAFAALAEFPGLLRRVVKQRKLTVDGRYDFRFYSPSEQQWIEVAVDDRLPVADGDGPHSDTRYVSISAENELWPPLYEKAFAKVCGGYHQLAGGASVMALHVMTGGETKGILRDCDDPLSKWEFFDVIVMSFDGTHKMGRATHWPDEAADVKMRPRDVNGLVRCLSALDARGCIMTCDCYDGKKGLIVDHVYSLIRVACNVANSGIDLLQLRNPWGKGEWTGAWSDVSKKWSEHPEVAAALGVIPPADAKAAQRQLKEGALEQDGIFWMAPEDFSKMFGNIDLVMMSDLDRRKAWAGAQGEEVQPG